MEKLYPIIFDAFPVILIDWATNSVDDMYCGMLNN